MKKRITACLLALCFLCLCGMPRVYAVSDVEDGEIALHTLKDGESIYANSTEEAVMAAAALELDAVSVLLMEANTGTVLYENCADEPLPPASVTKIMTLLLVMEAINGGSIKMTDMVSVSANAASMGGSQVFLKEGEEMTVEDLLKSVVIASANDAAVALAEYVAGSEEAFVEKMNARAAELGATGARFENTNGLDDTVTTHVMSARDIALISRALIAHKEILKYSSIWMDTIRDGAFGLTNTNRLVRFYPGCTGLKTGSTSKAGFCVSVTAEREGLSLICVIMGAKTRDSRNAAATKLLDWGFANYALATVPEGQPAPIPVTGGVKDACRVSYPEFSVVVPKADRKNLTYTLTLLPSLAAEVKEGDTVGEIVYYLGDREMGRQAVRADEAIARIGYRELLCRVLRAFFLAGTGS